MRKIVSLFVLTVMLITSVPMSLYISAGELLMSDTERAGVSEDIFYTDIFYTYPKYLKDNTYLNTYQAKTSGLISNVLSEYVTTTHFKSSVASQVLSQGFDIASAIKYIKANFNYQDFRYNDELDIANRLMIQALSENDLQKSASIYSKNASEHVKNFSSLTKLASTLEECTENLEDMGAIEDDLDVYEYLLETTFGFLEGVAPRLKGKLPEINDGLEKKLGDMFDGVSKAADALELASAVAVTVMAQETQLELVYRILKDAPTDSMLYAGMTRLKNQLEGGAVTFFSETFLQDAVYKKVIDLFAEGIFKAIGGSVASINLINIGIALVNVVNTVIFKWIMGADFDTYISAVLLADYKQGLADTLDNMSDRYAKYFSSDDIIAYDNVFNTYITVNYEAYKLYCKLSTHNTQYNSAYTSSMSGIYEDMSYAKYIAEVEKEILSIPDEVIVKADRGNWSINGTAELAISSDTVELGKYYIPRDFRAGITVTGGELIIPEGDGITIQDYLNVNGNGAKVTNRGTLTVKGDLNMGDKNAYLYNYGTLTVDNINLKGYYRSSTENTHPEFHNYNMATVINDINITVTSHCMFYMYEGTPELFVGGDIIANSTANFNITCGTLTLNGNEQQSVKNIVVNNFTVINPAGVKYLSGVYVRGRYDLCGNPLEDGAQTYLEGNGSLAPNNDYKNVSLNCDFTFEGNIKANISVNNNRKVTVPDGMSMVLDGNLTVSGISVTFTNNGDLAVTGNLNMGYADSFFHNYGTLTVENMTLDGIYRASYDNSNAEYYNYGKTVIRKNLTMTDTSLAMFFMTQGDPELFVGGDINAQSTSNFNVTCGALTLNGNEQQSVKNLVVNNLTVDNPEGIKYLSSIYVKGRYDPGENPVETGSYTTYLEGNGSLAPNNDYGRVELNSDLVIEGDITGDLIVRNNRKVTVPEGVKATIYGNLYVTGSSASFTNNGDLTVTGNLMMGDPDSFFYNYGTLTVENMTLDGLYRGSYDNKNAEYYNYGKTVIHNNLTFTDTSLAMFFMIEGDPELFVGGNIDARSNSNFNVTCGTLILNGTAQQSVNGLSVYNLTVTNPEGIKYLSSIYVKGRYDPNGNPVETGSYITYLEGNASLAPGNNYGRIELNTDLVIEGDITGDLIVRNNRKVTVPEGVKATINGNLYVTGSSASFTNNGDLTVTGDLMMGDPDSFFYNYGTLTVENMTLDGLYRGSYDNKNAEYYNYGKTVIHNNLTFTDTSLAMFFMIEGEPELFVGGNINAYSHGNFNVTCGTLTLNGSEQQSIKGLSVNNLTVTNPEGIKYQSDIYIKGRYDHCGNLLDTNGYCTKLEGSASLAPDNDYGDVHLNCDFIIEGDLSGRLSVTANGKKITVAEDTEAVFDGLIYLYAADTSLVNDGKLTVTDSIVMGNNTTTYVYNNGVMTVGELLMKGYYGNSYTQRRANFYNNGELTVTGDLRMEGTEMSYFYMNKDDAVLRVSGNIIGYKSGSFPSAKGNIILCGTEQQDVKCLSAYDLTIDNNKGIKYLSDTVINGRYDLCGNPLDTNGYCTKLEGNASLAPGNNYGDVHLNCDFTIEGNFAGRLSVTANGKKIAVAEGTEVVFDGLIYLYAADTSLVNDGKLTVTDSIVMGNNTTTYVYNNGVMTLGELLMKGYYGNSYTQRRAYFYNNGELTVTGDIRMEGTEVSYFYMNEDDAILRVGGNVTGYNANSFPNAKGKIIFDGDGEQTVKNFAKANVIEIENESYEGVNFATKVTYTTLFDHKGNRFTGSLSNVDYDGDGMYDCYDPNPTVNEKCSVIIRDYDVLIGHTTDINHIRYASGVHTTSASIREAEDMVNINLTLIEEGTLNNIFTYNMPDGGVYTFWIRLTDGTIIFRTVDMSQMKQRVSADGVRISLHNLYGVKDFFIAEGDFDSYAEIKQNGYIFNATSAKLTGVHSYTYTVSNPGRHTVLVRYTDTSRPNEVFKVDLSVEEPTFAVNGLQITIGNIPDVKVIRTAYGEYYTPGDVKRAEGARNFSNKTAIKDAESYKIQYREEGRITVIVEYNNGYIKVFHHDITQKKPTVEQNGNTVTFGDLDGLVMVRYAPGEYTASSEIKNAKGSKALKSDAVVDGVISITDLAAGSYTFCVQYDDESYNYYTITVE